MISDKEKGNLAPRDINGIKADKRAILATLKNISIINTSYERSYN